MAGKEISEIYCCKIESSGLTIYTASSKRGAVNIGLCLGKGHDCLKYFKKIFPLDIVKKDKAINRPLIEAIETALDGKTLCNDLKLDIHCTPFQRMVLEKIALIPYGQTRTYGEVAAIVGRPGCARAVGQVMKRNPLPIIFPCHRVVAARGLGGFSGGSVLKRYLLERESFSKR
jgi:O-6-methylguanine DNA methyltransferase